MSTSPIESSDTEEDQGRACNFVINTTRSYEYAIWKLHCDMMKSRGLEPHYKPEWLGEDEW